MCRLVFRVWGFGSRVQLKEPTPGFCSVLFRFASCGYKTRSPRSFGGLQRDKVFVRSGDQGFETCEGSTLGAVSLSRADPQLPSFHPMLYSYPGFRFRVQGLGFRV